MDKMKAISWDKLRRLVGRKKSKDRDTDGSRFQRSYSFKRASVRKSGRRATGSAALGAAAIAATTSAASNSSSSNENPNGGRASSCSGTDIGTSAPVSYHQHEQFHKSNGQLSSCSTSSNNSSAVANKLPKVGYQEVTVNVDVIADGKNILKQEQVFELKLGGHQNESAADVKVALVPQRRSSSRDKYYGSSTNLCDNNNLERSRGSKKHSSALSLVSSMSPTPKVSSRNSDKENGFVQRKSRPAGEMSTYDDEDDEASLNKWILMRNLERPMGRKQRAENIYRMITEDDSDYLDEEDFTGVGIGEDKYHKEMLSPVPNRNPMNPVIRGADSSGKKGAIARRSQMEADGEVFEDEFYLAMLAESPRPLRRSTDSVLSRLTSDSSHSRSRSRLDDNLDYGGAGVLADSRGNDNPCRSGRLVSACSSSDLVHERTGPPNYAYQHSNDNNGNYKSSNPNHRRRQQSPSAAVSPIPPPQMLPRPPSACALNNPNCTSDNRSSMNPVQKSSRAKRDTHSSRDDLVSDKNSPDSGSYHHHHNYGSSGKLSESKHGSGSSVSCSRDDLLADSKEVSPSPDLHLSPSHHVDIYPVAEMHSNSTEMLLSRPPPCSASSSSTYRTGLDDPTSTPKSFWWTQKPGSTMTTSSGASKDSGFSLGRSWAWGLAHKVFGKRAHGTKGPILSVSKEGYFQRTNLRRASGKRPAYPIPLRSSVTRKSSSKKRRSGRARRNNAASSTSMSNSAGTSNHSMSASSSSNHNNNNNRMVSSALLSSSPSLPSSPNLVKSTSFDNILEDVNDTYHGASEDNQEMENEIISQTSKLAIATSPSRCTSPIIANHPNNENPNAFSHEDSIFEEETVSIYQAHAEMSRRQRMLQRQQQHQQFQVFATPNSSEPLIFVPPERRKSSHSSSVLAHSKKGQPVPYSKTVFEIRNHCLPLLVPGAAFPILDQEPVELLRLPRLRCDKKSCEKSVLITKISGPYDNDGRLSRASCASGTSSCNGITSNSGVGGDCCQQSRAEQNSNSKLGDCLNHLSPCRNPSCANIRNSNNVGRRSSSNSHLNLPPHHHQIKQENGIDSVEVGVCTDNNNSKRDCKIRDKLPSNSLNSSDYHQDGVTVNGSHHPLQMNVKKDYIDDGDHNAVEEMLRKGGYMDDDDEEYDAEDINCVIPTNNDADLNLSSCYINVNGKVRMRNSKYTNNSGINGSNNAVRRKQSTRTNNSNHNHNRPSKVITKPSAVAVYRRYSTLYRRAKLGPNFALPRPTIKSGDITQKGYEKKRSRILAPYIPKQALAPKSNEGSASPSTRAKRRQHRRLTRNESRYHSEVRQEAVQQALAAMQNRPKPSLPMPSKRTSVMGRAPDHTQHDSGDSSTDDDSVGNEEGDLDDQDSGTPPERGDRNSRTNDTPQQVLIHSDSSSTGSARETPPMQRPPKLPERNRVSNGTPAVVGLTYANLGNLPGGNLGWDERPVHPIEHRSNRDSDRSSSGSNIKPQTPSDQQSYHHQHGSNLQRNSRPEITDLVEAMHNLRTHGSQSSQPPDVTSTGQSRRVAPADRLNRFNQKRSQSSADESSGTITGTGRWKVSAKIQQLLNTLKRPKRRPLPEFYEDDDIELEMAAKNKDPNAPKPEGSVMSPALGEQLVIPSGLPRNLEAAVQRYGSATFKAPVATVLDPNGKLTITLSYGKLLSRSHKIAFALLNKTGHKGESVVKTGDRVALVYPNNDPINFICAFYGCLFAGVVPVPIEVPLTRRDAGSQQIGFLLGSCSVQVALTSEACLKGLPKSAASGEVVAFKGWPKLNWFVTEHLGKAPKDWSPSPRVTDETPAYIEYTTDRDGSVMGVTMNRAAMLAHCRSLTTACNYTEGEVMVCVLDFKREVGLWHSILTSVFNGMHVIFIPYALMKVNPASWMMMITKYRASIAIVKSRDLHWGLLATRDHRDISLASLRLLLVSDGANPWSLSSCDQFLSVFQNKGLRPDAICPCASSSEALTVSLRRPGRAGVNATGRGVLSMQGLSYGVVRVDQENSLTSLTLQDCGQVMPGAVIVVVRMDGQPYLCKTDEVGEICVHSSSTGAQYWGLQGLTNQTFKVQPLQPDGTPVSDSEYVRSGLLGFLGPGGLVFVCGSRNGLMSVSGRKHNADDIIATVLAVEPMKFIYRGRIAVFSIKVLRDERICVIAEQRPDCSEEESFQWMSRVLQAVDSIHQVGIFCLVLVNPNCLPKTPLGGIHLSETKRRFLEGTLHPANVLMCPHTCVTNLPKPREIHSDVGPASVMVGNIVQGNRLASAQGRDLGVVDEESDTAKKYQFISEILKWRSTSTSDHVIFTLLNSKGTVTMTMTCSQLHKRAERVACLLLERAKINTGDHVALVYSPGLDLIAAFYGCLYAGAVPVTVRPPHPQNLQTTLPTVRMITEVSKSVLILSTQNVIKLLRSKEASNVVDVKSWPLTLDTDDLPKRKLASIYRAPTAEMIAYLDFSVSTTGMLAGIKMSHSAVTSLCRSMKLACELYPSRHVALCLDPYCGLGFALWCLSSVYSGHHSILIPPSEVEVNPSLWLSAVSQYKVRDTFCSYGVMELCTKGLGSSVGLLKQRGVNLACVRTCVVVAEERPRINLTNSFSKLFSALGLSPRAVSTSFGCRVNVGICLQGASSPEPSTVYVDLRSLRHDRVTLVERGAPHSLCLMESGKLLPGSKVIIANPDTKGQCGDSHLGEIWVQSPHNASGYFTIFGDESSYADHFNARLVTGNTGEVYARTGYLGFLRRTENVQADGELHDAVFVVGALDETIMLRGLRYHPIDIENSILRCHKKITECAVFTWTNLLVIVVELEGNENEALDVVPLVTNCVLEEHFLIVGVVVVVDPGVVPINSRGEKQRMHLRDGFLADQLDPIFVAYNM